MGRNPCDDRPVLALHRPSVCLKLSGLHLGLVLNFNVKNLSREGLMRRVNDFPG